jgi:hypothetical protein
MIRNIVGTTIIPCTVVLHLVGIVNNGIINYWRYSNKHIKARVKSAANPSQLVHDKKKHQTHATTILKNGSYS